MILVLAMLLTGCSRTATVDDSRIRTNTIKEIHITYKIEDEEHSEWIYDNGRHGVGDVFTITR